MGEAPPAPGHPGGPAILGRSTVTLMANTASARKAVRQSERRRVRNRAVRTRVRTATKAARAAFAPGADPATVAKAMSGAQSVIDRAAKRGVLHPRAAARRKSRLARRANAALAAQAGR
jgi:small subunit ribosomal protein S20